MAAAQGAGQGISCAPSRRSSAAVCGCAANELPYSTPSATRRGVRPSRAHHVERGAPVEEVLHHAVGAAVRRRVHRRLADVADRVDVGAQLLDEQPHRLQHLRLAGAVLVRRPGDPRRGHQRRDGVLGVDRRVGTVLQQQSQHFDVGGLGGQHERGGAGHVPPVARARPARLLHRVAAVDVRPVGQQRAQDAQPVQAYRDELVADVPVRHVHRRLQRPAEDVAAGDALGFALAVAELADHQRHRRGAHPLHRQPCRTALGVRIRARREQQVHEILVAVDHRRQQGRGAVGARFVDVGAGRQQGPHGPDAALARGEQQRRRAAVGARANVGAEDDQGLDDRDVSLRTRPHQGRLPVPGLAGVDVGARARQHPHGGGPSGARRQHQRRLAGVEGLPRIVRIDAGVQQPRDDRRIAVAGRQGQRRHAVVVGRVDVGPGPDQGRGGLRVVQVGGPVQGGGAVALRRVDVGFLREQGPYGRGFAAFRGVGERGPLGRGFEGAPATPGPAAQRAAASQRTSARPGRIIAILPDAMLLRIGRRVGGKRRNAACGASRRVARQQSRC